MKNFIIIPIILSVIALSLGVSIQSISGYDAQETKQQQSSFSIISTRNISDLDFDIKLQMLVDNTLKKFNETETCPSEIAIYIHGFNKDKDDAGEEFNRIHTALNLSNYQIPLIGFSWDSNVLWEQAKVNAKKVEKNLQNSYLN